MLSQGHLHLRFFWDHIYSVISHIPLPSLPSPLSLGDSHQAVSIYDIAAPAFTAFLNLLTESHFFLSTSLCPALQHWLPHHSDSRPISWSALHGTVVIILSPYHDSYFFMSWKILDCSALPVSVVWRPRLPHICGILDGTPTTMIGFTWHCRGRSLTRRITATHLHIMPGYLKAVPEMACWSG